ncbi:MAG: AAA family ATPase [Marinifilaceae bacterium]|jgi:cytidylate kinase
MNNILLKYMENRFKPEVTPPKEIFCEGPVVTISRECGCSAIKVANLLAQKLTERTGKEWRCLTKEILEKSAQELDLAPSKLEYVFNSKEKTTWDEILSALSSKYYQSDRKIKKTIAQVVRSFASKGNYIIVGRGGVVLTRDIEQSFHVKLHAPLEWRAAQLQKVYKLSLREMKKYASDTDKKREILRNYFNKEPLEDTIFDVIFNTMQLNDEQIAESCAHLIQLKGVLGKTLLAG